MKGFPKYFNTRFDVELGLTDYPEQTKEYLQTLSDNRFVWQTVSEHTEEPTAAEGQRVVPQEESTWLLQELVEDENCTLFRLGFTVDEVAELTK